jgi:hypothetical protein
MSVSINTTTVIMSQRRASTSLRASCANARTGTQLLLPPTILPHNGWLHKNICHRLVKIYSSAYEYVSLAVIACLLLSTNITMYAHSKLLVDLHRSSTYVLLYYYYLCSCSYVLCTMSDVGPSAIRDVIMACVCHLVIASVTLATWVLTVIRSATATCTALVTALRTTASV